MRKARVRPNGRGAIRGRGRGGARGRGRGGGDVGRAIEMGESESEIDVEEEVAVVARGRIPKPGPALQMY